MKSTIRTLALVMTLVMAVCLFVGCTKENLKGVTEDTIWVGNTAGTTGALASIGEPFNLGIEAAFAAYNADGGFGNKQQVKLKHYDDGGVATNSSTYMDKLIHEDEVFAIVGNFGANSVAANLDIIKDAKVPMVYAAAGNDVLLNENATADGDRGIFPVQPLNKTEGRMLLLRSFAPVANGGLAGTKVGVISNTNEASRALVEGIKAEAENLPADKKANVTYQEVASTDYTGAVNALKNAGCDVVILTVIGADFTTVLTTMANADFTCKVMTTYNNASAAVFNDATTTLMADQYVTVFEKIQIYAQGWLDISSTTYVYNAETPLAAAYEALYTGMGMPYTGVVGFNEAYWVVAENIFNYATSAGRNDALAMSYNSYALAGYIAGDLFCQGLQALEDAGKELTRANYVDIMESKEFNIAMADKISFANGMRAGVQSFSSTLMYDAFTINGGLYHSAMSMTVHGLTSIESYRQLIGG